MGRPNTEYVNIKIEDLFVNPENKRYIEYVDSEITAIIEMFNVTNGNPMSEMFALAKDIADNALNPFELPIVWYDDEIKKYIVVEGNRRISCIKLMTQYKNNIEIESYISSIKQFWEFQYTWGDKIQCVVYENYEEANSVLLKIHQDINGGIGRKPWGAHEKQKNKAEMGDKSRTYAIIEFVKNHPLASKELIAKVNAGKWTSKLERVVGFADFKIYYNITFGTNNTLFFKDTSEQLFKMLEYLIIDLIEHPATGNSRTKNNFHYYCLALPSEFKTQVDDDNLSNQPSADDQSYKTEASPTTNNDDIKEKNNSLPEDNNDLTENELPEPKSIQKFIKTKSYALGLSKEYTSDEMKCLHEKGKGIMNELASLDVDDYPYASAALCREIIEFILLQWCKKLGIKMNSDSLHTSFGVVINRLQAGNIIDSKRHSTLSTTVNKEKFIEVLNTWMHPDELQCVKPETLKNGWIACRILIEIYIQESNK